MNLRVSIPDRFIFFQNIKFICTLQKKIHPQNSINCIGNIQRFFLDFKHIKKSKILGKNDKVIILLELIICQNYSNLYSLNDTFMKSFHRR